MSCKWMDQHDTDNDAASPSRRRKSVRDLTPSQLKALKHSKAAAPSQELLPCAVGMQGTKLWQPYNVSEYVLLNQSPDGDLC